MPSSVQRKYRTAAYAPSVYWKVIVRAVNLRLKCSNLHHLRPLTEYHVHGQARAQTSELIACRDVLRTRADLVYADLLALRTHSLDHARWRDIKSMLKIEPQYALVPSIPGRVRGVKRRGLTVATPRERALGGSACVVLTDGKTHIIGDYGRDDACWLNQDHADER